MADQDPDDVVAKLERLTGRASPAPAGDDLPPSPSPPPPASDTVAEVPATPPAHGISLADLHREMDELREQLDHAFAEVMSQTSQLDERLVELTRRVDQGLASLASTLDELRTTLGVIKDRLVR